MKMPHFISGSAVMIAGWLMLTFLHDVSPQQYPQQRRGTPAHAVIRGAAKSEGSAPAAMAETAIGLTATPKR
ncbi:MAG: hypothetical protein WCP45_12155 [Verrucomicrobiota bacterium]